MCSYWHPTKLHVTRATPPPPPLFLLLLCLFGTRAGGQVAFLGRSNVGKSSLVGALLKDAAGGSGKGLVRTSKTPGRLSVVGWLIWGGGGRSVLLPADCPARWCCLWLTPTPPLHASPHRLHADAQHLPPQPRHRPVPPRRPARLRIRQVRAGMVVVDRDRGRDGDVSRGQGSCDWVPQHGASSAPYFLTHSLRWASHTRTPQGARGGAATVDGCESRLALGLGLGTAGQGGRSFFWGLLHVFQSGVADPLPSIPTLVR